MSTTRLSRSTPFWVLVGGSVVTIAGGAYLLVSKLTLMATTLTDGTATGVEVYAGQIWAVLGAILVGVGAIGLALALTLGALRTIVAGAAPAAPAWEEEIVEVAAYTPAAETVALDASTDASAAPAEESAPETRAAARATSEASEPAVALEASEPVVAFDEAPAASPAAEGEAPRER